MRHEIGDGKYTVIYDTDQLPCFTALRHGEPWRDLTGDNLVLLMLFEIDQLSAELAEKSKPDAAPITVGGGPTNHPTVELTDAINQGHDKDGPVGYLVFCHEEDAVFDEYRLFMDRKKAELYQRKCVNMKLQGAEQVDLNIYPLFASHPVLEY